MSAPFQGRRQRRRPTINITSLIDVMFLLLIFFMVSSTFRQTFGVDITLPEAKTASETQADPNEILVAEDGSYYVGDRPVDEDGLREALASLLEADEEAIVVLRADEKADFGRAIRAIDIARELGTRRLIIPTRYQTDLDE